MPAYKTALEMKIYAREQKVVQDKKKFNLIMSCIEAAADRGEESTEFFSSDVSNFALEKLKELGYQITKEEKDKDGYCPFTIYTVKW